MRYSEELNAQERIHPWAEFMRSSRAGQDLGNSAVNTTMRDAPTGSDGRLQPPDDAVDAALERFRNTTGHALQDRQPLPVATATLPWGAPREAPVNEAAIPASMVPDAAIRLTRLIDWLGALLAAWQHYRMVEALRRLDDHLLRDLGLTREDLRGGERTRNALRRLDG